MKITIGITTYNRKEYLKKFKKSLYESKKIDECNIRIYDDASTDYDRHFLESTFENAKSIFVNKKNIGADSNMHNMHLDFVKSGDDVLISADSDLIFHPEWIDFVKSYLPLTDGILCLYNSSEHPADELISFGGTQFCIKKHIGSAGTVFHKDVVNKIVKNVSSFSKKYDWEWSEYLLANKYRLITSDRSYVQHIGVEGQNCNMFLKTDFGLNFIPGSLTNANIISEYIQEINLLNAQLAKTREQALKKYCEAKIEYQFGNFFLSPLIKAKRNIMQYLKKNHNHG